jgi:tRNA pseudouridine32 synthase/23S rRNA pseudouridine746 synthase
MLPVRDGVGPSSVALPPGPWPTLLDFLVARFPALSAAEWRARIEAGDVVDGGGRSISAAQAYAPHGKLHYYRQVQDEPAAAAPCTVLFEDELLVVADKPPFLPVTPSGRYLQQTLLVRLRRQLGVPALTPLHRIDRETAGVVLFAKQPATCGSYEALFAARQVAKQYEAIAPASTTLRFPITRTSPLADAEHFMQMREVPASHPGARAARTVIELLETQGPWARYRLHPLTGRRHQLRVHMAGLGLPILGDRIYPTLQPVDTDDPRNPLRLLAQRISFQDPVTGQARSFASARSLSYPAATL